MADVSAEKLEDMEKNVRESEDGIRPTPDFERPEKLYDDLIASVHKYHPSTDITMIEKAYRLARDAHNNQLRKSGEP